MAETLATLTAALAAINGLVYLFTIFGKLFMMFRFGTSFYDLVDTLYAASNTPELRDILVHAGGGNFLLEMDKMEGDAKKLAKEADITRAEVQKIAYKYKIILREYKAQALREKQRARKPG